jgi:uncharacterized membrane-anchored protein
MVKHDNKNLEMTYLEYQLALFGAAFLALGVGIVFQKYLQVIGIPLILLGIALHGYGMYKINKRNIK